MPFAHHASWIIFALCLISGGYFAWRVWRPASQNRMRWLRGAALALLLGAALVSFGRWGDWQVFYSHDGTPQGAASATPERGIFHFHEIWHYYLGAKYFPELQYDGLYEAILLADHLSPTPMITRERIRDLGDPTHHLPRTEVLAHAEQVFRPRFTEMRWQAFRADVAQLMRMSGPGWADLGMFDLGFNPPPSWAVVGYPLANLLPLNLFLPWIDVGLMLGLAILLWRWLGAEAGAAFVIASLLAYVADIGWVYGSFFRLWWLACLGVGMAALQQARYRLAGAALASSAAAVAFPALFGLAAAWILFWRGRWTQNYEALRHLLLGALVASLLWLGASVALFGVEFWREFLMDILPHSHLFFVKHLGYQKLALFTDWVPNQDFWWHGGIDRFRAWNNRLWEQWEWIRWAHLPFMLGWTVFSLWLCRKMAVAEGALMTGVTLLFLFTNPANYYYALLALLPALLVARPVSSRMNVLLVLWFFACWGVVHLFHLFVGDDLVEYHYIGLVFLVFFLGWHGLRLIPLALQRSADAADPTVCD